MEPEQQADASGTRRERAVRLLLGLLVVIIAFNLWDFAREQQGDRRLRVRRPLDVEELASRSSSKAVRHHHGTYYRLARELHGVTLHMDEYTARLHRAVLEGLGNIDVVVSKRKIIRLGGTSARPLLEQATWSTRLDDRRLNVLLEAGQREYVVAWVGKASKARMLILPLARFTAAGGKL